MAVVALFLAWVLWQLYLSQFNDAGYEEPSAEWMLEIRT
jgi:hypothetical protein